MVRPANNALPTQCRAQLGNLVRALALCAALFSAPDSLASAPGARARLRYERLAGSESCPPQAGFQAEVAAWLGYDPFSETSPREVVIRLSGGLSGAEGGLAASLRLVDQAGKVLGERAISSGSSDCRDLTQALVLAVALAVDPLPIAREVIAPAAPPQASPVAPTSPTPSAAPVAVAPVPAEVRAEGLRTVVSLTLGPSLWVQAGPQPAPGGVAGIDLRWGHFSLGLDAQADAFTGEAYSPGSIQVSRLTGELLPCYRGGLFGICALVAVGAELGHGQGLKAATSQPLPYIGAGARLLAELPLAGPWSCRVQIDGLGTALGASFHVGNVDVWDTPSIAFEFAAALALRL